MDTANHTELTAGSGSTSPRWYLDTLATVVVEAQARVQRLPYRRLQIAWLSSVRLFVVGAYRFVRSGIRAEADAHRAEGRLDEAADRDSVFEMVTAMARTSELALDRLMRRYTGRKEWAEEVLLRWGHGRSIGAEGDCLHELISLTLAAFIDHRAFRVDLARVALMLAMHPVTVSEETQRVLLQTRHPLDVFVEGTLS